MQCFVFEDDDSSEFERRQFGGVPVGISNDRNSKIVFGC